LEDDSGTSLELVRVFVIVVDGESTTSSGFPSVLGGIIIRLGDDSNLVSNEESGVETDTELTDHTDISTRLKGFHEGLGSRLGDGTEVVDEFLLGHTDTGIFEDEEVVGSVGDDLDLEVRFVVDGVASDGFVSDLIEGIRGVGDEFSQEDLLV